MNWNIFFQFSPILQPVCLDWHPPRVETHGPQTVSLDGGPNQVFFVGACRLLLTGCTRPFCWAGRCTPANLHPFCTPRACSFANQRFLGCIWGGNSPWSEFICGHGGCLLTKEAASNTGTVQNGRKSQTYCQYSMQTRSVPNSPFQGLSEYTPHTPTYGTPSRPK